MTMTMDKAEQINYIRMAYRFVGDVLNIIRQSNGKVSDEGYKKMFDLARDVVSSNLRVTSNITKMVDGIQTVPIVVGKKYVVRFQYDGGQITKINIYDKESNKVIKISRKMVNYQGRGRVSYDIKTDTFQMIKGVNSLNKV